MTNNYQKMMADIEKLLRSGMRYCFPQVQPDGKTTFPELQEEPFKAADGFLYLIEYAFRGYVKRAYQAGYAKGVEDAVADINMYSFNAKDEVKVSFGDSKIGSERGFIKWESESD